MTGHRVLYTPAWRRLRAAMIAKWRSQGEVRCHICMRTLSASDEVTVDHLKPASKFPELALDPKNLLPACRPCNSRKKDRWRS